MLNWLQALQFDGAGPTLEESRTNKGDVGFKLTWTLRNVPSALAKTHIETLREKVGAQETGPFLFAKRVMQNKVNYRNITITISNRFYHEDSGADAAFTDHGAAAEL